MTYSRMPNITDWQRQVIIGTLLGTSAIYKAPKARNAMLIMRGHDQKWIQCKAQEIEEFTSENPYTTYERKGNPYYAWHSKCSPLFNHFQDMFYQENKKIVTMEILNELRDIGMAVWFVDCGEVRDNRVIIPGNEIISQYFSEIGIENEMKDKEIILTEEATNKFIYIVAPNIPEFKKNLLVG